MINILLVFVTLETTYPGVHIKAAVGRIEKRVDLAWKCERVQLPGPSLSLSAVVQLASKAPSHSVALSNSFFLACFSSLVFFCLLVFVM